MTRLVPVDDLPIWRTFQEYCPACKKTFTTVYPITAERLECSCGHWNPAPPLPREPSRKTLLG